MKVEVWSHYRHRQTGGLLGGWEFPGMFSRKCAFKLGLGVNRGSSHLATLCCDLMRKRNDKQADDTEKSPA